MTAQRRQVQEGLQSPESAPAGGASPTPVAGQASSALTCAVTARSQGKHFQLYNTHLNQVFTKFRFKSTVQTSTYILEHLGEKRIKYDANRWRIH